MAKMKENLIYEHIMDAAEAIIESQKRKPEKVIILSSEQIKRLESGESKFEMGICNAPYNTSPITREEYLLSKKEVDKCTNQLQLKI